MEPIKLKEIADELDAQLEDYRKYYKKNNGEIIAVSCKALAIAEDANEGDDFSKYPSLERDNILKALEIIADEDYIDMPDKDEIDEYGIMQNFAFDNEELECYMLTGDYQEVLIRQGIEEDWNDFKKEALTKIARDWCKYNGLAYED